jgi:galactose mutarotase-like enzyme
MTVEVSNRGAEAMPMAFGFHPAFRWPLPGGGAREAHVIEFAEAEAGPLRRLGAEGLLDAAARPNPVQGGRLALADDLFAEDAMIFEKVSSGALRFGADGGRWLSIVWSDLPHLGVWTKPGAPYLCIEPWRSLPAEAGPPTGLAEASDLAVLAPGQRQAFSMSVRLD